MTKNRYTQFTESSMAILQDIESSLSLLSKRISDLSSRQMAEIGKAMEYIREINSIYSNFNNADETPYIRELSRIAAELARCSYLEKETAESLRRTLTLISESLKKSAGKKHPFTGSPPAPAAEYEKTSSRFKWLTFQRNGSWFITDFTSSETLRAETTDTSSDTAGIIRSFSHEGNIIKLSDIMIPAPELYRRPYYIIIIDGGSRAYAADSAGKKIYADKNIFSNSQRTAGELQTGPYRGWFRLFGRNHILIDSHFTVNEEKAKRNCAGA